MNDRVTLDTTSFQNANETYPITLEELWPMLEWKTLLAVQNRLPCVVTAIEGNDVFVQPTIKLVFAEEAPETAELHVRKTEDRPIIKVQIYREFAGGVGIYFPVSVGDTGWVEAADRDTQSYKAQTDLKASMRPLTLSSAQYRYGFFVPDTIQKSFTVAADDEGCLCLQTVLGNTKIVIDPATEQIRIKSPLSVDVEAPTVTIKGNLNVTGTITAPSVVAGGTEMEKHRHAPSITPPTNP